jgi:8-oxo-dGTP diphosphatase
MLEDSPQTGEVVRAAGGIVVRRGAEGWREVAVVHRPAREDWSFPKGKLEPDESLETCALREVLEETGLVCRLGRFIGHTQYRDRKDRPKVVAYWVMEAEGGSFMVNEEVDEVRWVRFSEAGDLLSYERDRELLVVVAAADEVGPLP